MRKISSGWGRAWCAGAWIVGLCGCSGPVSPAGETALRAVLGFGGALLIILATRRDLLSYVNKQAIETKYVLAFDATIFTVLGLAVLVTAASRWEVALLLAGACLLGGGFIGLLFGYPQSAAQQAAGTPPRPADGAVVAVDVPQAAVTVTTPPRNNLVAESAATLGKVLTGFTLAKLNGVTSTFTHLTQIVAPALCVNPAEASPVLAGVAILYFLLVGFLSGLFLSSYFMRGEFS